MDKYLKSKSVISGDVVTLRGNKYIRCGGRLRPSGVWQDYQEITIKTLDGESNIYCLPAGVQTKGIVTVVISPRCAQ